MVEALLQHQDINVNSRGPNGFTALLFAALEGDIDVMRALLEHQDIDFNSQDELGRSPLHLAILVGPIKGMKHRDIDVDQYPRQERTSLYC